MSFAFHGLSDDALKNGVQWGGSTSTFIGAQLVTDAWVDDPGFRFLSEIGSVYRPYPKTVLTGRNVDDGAARSDSIVFPKVPTGHTYKGVVFFNDTGVSTSSKLLVYHDDAEEWPVVANGGNITFIPSLGPDGIFRIGTFPCP